MNCGDSENDFQAIGRAFPDFWPVRIENEGERLDWHRACHILFLFYRDLLRDLWRGNQQIAWLGANREEVLLGLSDENERVCQHVKQGGSLADLSLPFDLHGAWQQILAQFPNALVEKGPRLQMRWRYGEFVLVPHNDFHRAFYLLFRQSWRARVCSGCKTLFIARKPKQKFCGTQCSAGSRLASMRKWWNRVGAKKRTSQRETGPKANRRGRERK